MAVTLTHTQTRSVSNTGLYQVADSITASSGISTAVFVYRVDTTAFDRIASAADMGTYPDTLAAAVSANAPYYRQTSVTSNFTLLTDAQAFSSLLIASLKTLCVAVNALQTGFVGTTTATVSS